MQHSYDAITTTLCTVLAAPVRLEYLHFDIYNAFYWTRFHHNESIQQNSVQLLAKANWTTLSDRGASKMANTSNYSVRFFYITKLIYKIRPLVINLNKNIETDLFASSLS